MSLLAAHEVSRTYRKSGFLGTGTSKTVLERITVEIAEGETVALLGRSGCGKSTLARLLVGLELPDEGETLFEGRPLRHFRKADWRALRRAVQLVFQDPVGAVDPRATVRDILSEPLRNLCGLPQDACDMQVRSLLEAVELKADDADKLPQQMSGGQLQRVCIARALAPQPRLIILDEAVSNLDLHLQIQMLDLFTRLQKENGVSYLFVTHDLRLVQSFCSRVIVMDDGHIVEECPVTTPFALTSPEGRALQGAVLPAMPVAMPVQPGVAPGPVSAA
ncbi:MAG: nickel import ATP-binding protein NikE [Xanthobacter sp.]